MKKQMESKTVNKSNLTISDEIVKEWQNTVNIMAELMHVPAALIMKVEGSYIEVFRSSESNGNPYKIGDREHLAGLYCECVTQTNKKLLVPNALKDSEWNTNPDIKLGMISYLGFPLLWPDDEVFGTICVLDSKENRFSEAHMKLMSQFKDLIEMHLELLCYCNDLEQKTVGLKEVNEKLRQSETNLRGIVEHSAEVFFVHNTMYEITYVSPQSKAIFGYTPDEMKAKWSTLSSDALVNRKRYELTERAIKTGQKQKPHLVEMKRKDGKYRIVEVDESPIKDEDGKVVAITGTLRDITNRKKAEDKLLKYQSKLKAMASQNLQAEEHEKRRLAIGLHDNIGTRLAVMKLLLDSSLHSVSDTTLASSLRTVCETMGKMIEEAESWTYDLSSPVLRTFGLVSAVEEYIKEKIQRTHGITCELKSDKDIGILSDDVKAFLFRAIKELLTNVVKHANAHKIEVSIQRKHGHIYARVQDDGIGFKKKGDLELSEMEGFGLFGIREQLAHFGGNITIKSEGGRGTTVMVALPSITE